jgi:hypothetical protein
MRRLHRGWLLVVTIGVLAALPASGAPPTVEDFLSAMKLSVKDIERARAGEIITGTTKGSNDRELVATMAFVVPGAQPDELVVRGEGGLLDEIDEQTIAYSMLPDDPTLENFAALKLRPGDIKQFSRAESGKDLNLSTAELDAFQKLGKSPSAAQVEEVVRASLLARVRSYREGGLVGIAPYQRSGDKFRSPAEDLKQASLASEGLRDIAPTAYEALLTYPDSVPEGTEETYRWSYLEAHGEPTIVLTHNLYIPDGEAWIVFQRQFYVSEGYNCEQAIAAFVPVDRGTAVFYINRTSTDQVSGFGGGVKRSIGSKLLSSQLKALFEKFRSTVEEK